MLAAQDEKELEAVGQSVKATVPAGHRERLWLEPAYRARREEIRQKAAEKAAKKAKEDMEKAENALTDRINAQAAEFIGALK